MSCSDEQIKAAVDYIIAETKKGGGEAAPKAADVSVKKLTLADGKQVYGQYCAICHDNGHLNAPKIGDQAAWAPRIQQGMDVLFVHALNGFEDMPKKGTCNHCTDAEVIAATKYLVQQSKTHGDFQLW